MSRCPPLPAETVVLTGAEFDVLEQIGCSGLRLFDERFSAIEVKAISDLLARGFLVADAGGRLMVTHFGDAISSSVHPVPGKACYRGRSQRGYVLVAVSVRVPASKTA